MVIEPPESGSGDWAAKSMTPNRPQRVDLVVDGATGVIKDRTDFQDRHLIDRIVGTGIAAHEGQLFGWPNQLLGLTTAAGLVLLLVSSVVMWWRRRAPGGLGARRRGEPSLFARACRPRGVVRDLPAPVRSIPDRGVDLWNGPSCDEFRGFASGWDFGFLSQTRS